MEKEQIKNMNKKGTSYIDWMIVFAILSLCALVVIPKIGIKWQEAKKIAAEKIAAGQKRIGLKQIQESKNSDNVHRQDLDKIPTSLRTSIGQTINFHNGVEKFYDDNEGIVCYMYNERCISCIRIHPIADKFNITSPTTDNIMR